MESENCKTFETNRKKKIEKITTLLGVQCFICLIAGALCLNSLSYKKYIFYLFDFLVILILVVIPMLDLIGEGKDGNRYIRNFTMFIDIILAVMLCILSYFIFNVQLLVNKPYYPSVNRLGMIALFFIAVKTIIEFIKKMVQYLNGSKSKVSLYFTTIFLFIAFLLTSVMPFIKLYKPGITVYAKNIKVPDNFEVRKVNRDISADSHTAGSKIGTINDKKLIERICSDVNNKKYENIRNLDELNDLFSNYNSSPYYMVTSSYEESNGNQGSMYGIDDGYICLFTVYGNGQVEITEYNEVNGRFGQFFFPKYRVYLSESTKNDLLNAIRALDNF